MKDTGDEKRKRRRIAWAIAGGIVAVMLILLAVIGTPLLKLVSRPMEFQSWVNSKGIFGPILYIALVILQVVIAVIPGEPFEIAGGYAFGAIWGTVFALVGATVGSILVFLLVRRFGVRLAERFFSKRKLSELNYLRTSPQRSLLFLIVFSIPGTPKDLLCYFAGLTDMKLWTWILISSFGRLPSLVTSTIGGDALGEQRYWLAAIVFAATVAVSGIGLLIYHLIGRRHRDADDSDSDSK